MSLVTLLGYGVYLHLRINGEHPPKTLAWVSVIGFILMLITYFGVNLMGVGLHSYGRIG
jgi:ABC-type transport system involved in cytochrome c biogenesis permease subunit